MGTYGKYKVPFAIFLLQRLWRRTAQFWYWVIRCMFLTAARRLFIFRHAPNWFVFLLAKTADSYDRDDDFHTFLLEAKKERGWRRLKRNN